MHLERLKIRKSVIHSILPYVALATLTKQALLRHTRKNLVYTEGNHPKERRMN